VVPRRARTRTGARRRSGPWKRAADPLDGSEENPPLSLEGGRCVETPHGHGGPAARAHQDGCEAQERTLEAGSGPAGRP
jgi:hypothetical protein